MNFINSSIIICVWEQVDWTDKSPIRMPLRCRRKSVETIVMQTNIKQQSELNHKYAFDLCPARIRLDGFHWFLSLHSPEIARADFSVITTFNAILWFRFIFLRFAILSCDLRCAAHFVSKLHKTPKHYVAKEEKSCNLWTVATVGMVSYHFFYPEVDCYFIRFKS